MINRSRWLSSLLLALCLSWSAFAQQPVEVLPWTELHPGNHAVGYQVRCLTDVSRTWHTTRAFGKPFAADRGGRPVRVSIWYPATPKPAMPRMRMADYLKSDVPLAYTQANAALQARDRRVLAEMVPQGSLPALLDSTVPVYAGAAPDGERFPLVLYSSGVNPYTLSNVFMTELLASHGYVVAVAPSLGPSDEQVEQSYTLGELETSVRDLEFAWSYVRHLPFVDESRLGIFGHSLGGTVAMLFALRNRNVSAVAALDGTYGFAGSAGSWDTTLTGITNYEPSRMRAALLDVHRGGTNLDLHAIEAFNFAERFYITLPNMLHGDFTTFVVVARAFMLPPPSDPPSGWTRETGYAGFRTSVQLVLDFFEQYLNGRGSFGQQASELARSDPGATFAHQPALPASPSAPELAAILQERGYEATLQLIDQLRAQSSGIAVVDGRALNTMGYALSAQGLHQRAIDILRLVTHAYPQSANAHDSLGDAYLAAGDANHARLEFQQALSLAPADSSLSPDSRTSLLKLEHDKLAQLQH